VDPSTYVPGPIEVGWQIWFAAVVSTVPFVIGAYEFGKRIVSTYAPQATHHFLRPSIAKCIRRQCSRPFDVAACAFQLVVCSMPQHRILLCCVCNNGYAANRHHSMSTMLATSWYRSTSKAAALQPLSNVSALTAAYSAPL
jgi:hypothetical protein